MRIGASPVVVLVALLMLPASARAEQPVADVSGDAPRWTLQVDPLTTALSFVHLHVERAINPRWSVYVSPHLRVFDGVLPDLQGPFWGVGAEVGVRRFLTGSAPAGAWVQLRGVGAMLSTTEGPQQRAFGGYVSALGGYTAIFDGWFVLSGGLGLQYIRYRVGGMGPKGPLPAAHTTVGVAF